MTNKEILEKFFAGENVTFPLQPVSLIELDIEKFGYERTDIDTNGWEMSYWITYTKKQNLDIIISGNVFFGQNITINYRDEKED